MSNANGKVLAVVGGQFGSEGKGNIVHHLANRFEVHVRTGAPNAGHSFKYAGSKRVMQSLPCGWTNPNATLVIGRGALVNPAILQQEIEEVLRFDPSILDRVVIDPLAGVISEHHHASEGGVGGELHRRIGSTGEGVGAARLDRIRRDPTSFQQMKDVASSFGGTFWDMYDLLQPNTPQLLAQRIEQGQNVLLEGTQGYGLSLIHGPWPYCTSNDTNAAQLAADAGLAPQRVTDVIVVFRTFPIRVAGNSGPLLGEMSWEQMSQLVGHPVEEKTTVTKKIRRVGCWDWELACAACTVNQPTALAINFMDYLFPAVEGASTREEVLDRAPEAASWLRQVEGSLNAPVKFLGTGGPNWNVVEWSS